MERVTMPEPVARATVHMHQDRRQFSLAELGTEAVGELTWGEYDLITTDQAEAYAAAKVREALEGAAKICDETYVEPGDLQVESCYEAAEKIRALIPHNDSEQGE